MNTDPPMPMIANDVVKLVIVEDEQATRSEEVVVNGNVPKNPQIDNNNTKLKKGKEKVVL